MSILNPSSRGAKRRASSEIKPAMLEAAAELIHREGLTVSLQHISMDGLASLAGISRSAVYRAWPNREDFFDELLLKLCYKPESHPMVFDGDTLNQALQALKDQLSHDPDVLATTEGRRMVIVEMCRRGATTNYENLVAHTAWRTWIALAATTMSYPEPMKSKLQSAIAETEGAYVNNMAEFYKVLCDVLGRKILPQFRSETESSRHEYAYLAATGSATMEGLVLRSTNFPAQGAGTMPNMSEPASDADPFETGKTGNWNAAAIAFTGTFMAMTAPVEEYQYSPETLDKQIADVEEVVRAMTAKATINGSPK